VGLPGAEAVEQDVGDVSQARDEPPAEQPERTEHELCRAVGVGGVLARGVAVGEHDRVECVQAFAFGDGDHFAVEVRVLVVDPDHPRHHLPPVARFAGGEPGERAAPDHGVALPVGGPDPVLVSDCAASEPADRVTQQRVGGRDVLDREVPLGRFAELSLGEAARCGHPCVADPGRRGEQRREHLAVALGAARLLAAGVPELEHEPGIAGDIDHDRREADLWQHPVRCGSGANRGLRQ
jgi:hypothetical protein